MSKPTDRDEMERELGVAVMMAIRDAVGAAVRLERWSQAGGRGPASEALWNVLAREIECDRAKVKEEVSELRRDLKGHAISLGVLAALICRLREELAAAAGLQEDGPLPGQLPLGLDPPDQLAVYGGEWPG